jgi:hypothetical protein
MWLPVREILGRPAASKKPIALSLRRRELPQWETVVMEVPEIFFADAGGVSIAWQQFGSGPDVLAVPGARS